MKKPKDPEPCNLLHLYSHSDRTAVLLLECPLDSVIVREEDNSKAL